MKSLTRAVGLLVAVAGVVIILVPGAVIAVARHPIGALQLYASAVIRIGIGALFIAAARDAHARYLLRVLGGFAILAGIGTFFLGVERARAISGWISQQPLGVVRLFGLLPLMLGGLVVYASGVPRRAV